MGSGHYSVPGDGGDDDEVEKLEESFDFGERDETAFEPDPVGINAGVELRDLRKRSRVESLHQQCKIPPKTTNLVSELGIPGPRPTSMAL